MAVYKNLNTQHQTDYTDNRNPPKTINSINLQVCLVRVSESDDGQRLDNFLAKRLKGTPRSHIQRIIRSGEVRVDGARAAFDTRLVLNQTIRIPPLRLSESVHQSLLIDNKLTDNKTNTVNKKTCPFPIVFEDDHIVVINKPSGVAVHGGSGIALGVIEHVRQTGMSSFLELAHRIDRDTSGILVIAKRRPALVALQAQLREGVWKKNYRCVVLGKAPFTQQDINSPLLRIESNNGERRVVVSPDKGQYALSRLRVLRQTDHFSELNVRIMTGRTHQIRVHCASVGLPLVGDEKYGVFERNKILHTQPPKLLKRLMLHATQLTLPHPITGDTLSFTTEPPEDYQRFVNYYFK